MSDNRCICCGQIIPEGLQVCPSCEAKAGQPNIGKVLAGLKCHKGNLCENKDIGLCPYWEEGQGCLRKMIEDTSITLYSQQKQIISLYADKAAAIWKISEEAKKCAAKGSTTYAAAKRAGLEFALEAVKGKKDTESSEPKDVKECKGYTIIDAVDFLESAENLSAHGNTISALIMHKHSAAIRKLLNEMNAEIADLKYKLEEKPGKESQRKSYFSISHITMIEDYQKIMEWLMRIGVLKNSVIQNSDGFQIVWEVNLGGDADEARRQEADRRANHENH